MASAGLKCLESPSQSINGVTLFTRAGKPKSRYSRSEMLQILGATEEDLQSFLEIFAPRQPYYAITRAASSDPRDWTTPKGRQPNQKRRLRDEEVLRHLAGNLLPGRPPRWVAPRAWEATLWVGIDVDFRGDREDFLRRCREVHRALRVLGVSRESRLVSRTPSGGRHYRFFLTRAIRTADIPSVMSLVGLPHVSGQHEIFPSMQRGMRLPFGHLPGHADQPQSWVTFIRDWKVGRIRRVNWLRCLRRAERFAQRQVEGSQGVEPLNIDENKTYPTACVPHRAISLGIPRRSQSMSRATGSKDGSETRYQELLYQPWANPSAAQELWNLGIRLPGTRVEATKRLAWHLVHIRRLPLPQAESELTCWVYETGAKYSKDVREDIAAGTRQVERQTREIVRWCASQPLERKGFRRQSFSAMEIDAIVATVHRLAMVNNTDQIEFGLRLLEFAKSHGIQKPRGWEVQISIRGVIRTWPKCSGMRYKPFMDRAIESGLLRKTREKLQSRDGTGRPRTYLIQVSSPGEGDSTAMAFAEAVVYSQASLQGDPNALNAAECKSEASDTYQNVPPTSPITAGKIHEAAALESAESMSRDDEFSVGTVMGNTAGQGFSAITNILKGQPNVCRNSSACTGLGHVRYGQLEGRIAKSQEREYPPSPGTYLAEGQAERPAIGSSLSGIPDQGIGKLPAPPPRPVPQLTPQQRLFRKGISPLRLKARSTTEVSLQQRERARLNLIKTSLGS